MSTVIFFKVQVNDGGLLVFRSSGQPVYAIYASEMWYFLVFCVSNNFEIKKSTIGQS